MSRLALYFLGPPRVELDGEEIQLGRRKVTALLAYLAVTGERHSRDSLTTLLWPEYDQSRARADLRRTLSQLNHKLGKRWLAVDRETAGFNPDADLWLDVNAFRQRFAAHETHDHAATELCTECAPLLKEAAEMYRDDFLAGFTLRDSLQFDEWQFFQTEELRRALGSALECLVNWHREQADFEPAIGYARRWLALDPLHEPVHRHLMELFALTGQQSAALRQYRTCLRVLEEELDAPPSAETTALYERICAERIQPPHTEVSASPPVAPASTPLPAFLRPGRHTILHEEQRPAAIARPVFVTREHELARLDGYLEAALAGQGQVVFVTGGPGLGKTALMHEFGRRAMESHADLLVASGHCHAHSGIGDPYVPFCEVMGMLTGDIETHWRVGEVTDEHARRLWAALPVVVKTLLDRGPHLFDIFVPGAGLLSRASVAAKDGAPWLEALREWVERPGARSYDLEQAQLFQQLINVLRTLAEARPLLLTLDDFQWADTASISLLFHLGRRLEGCRVLTLCAYRPEEVALGRPELAAHADSRVGTRQLDRHPLEQALTEFKRQSGDVWVDLSQADETQGRRFVAALLDTEPNLLEKGFREELFRRTGGHPLFTVELLRTMQEQRDLVKDEQGRWVEGPGLDWRKSPARVEAVIEARVGRLGEELQDILAVASVEGERFTAQVVADVQEIDERELLRTLTRELVGRHGLVREVGEVQVGGRFLSRYRFSHTLFQNYAYNSLSAGERRLLHGEIAAAMERLWGEQKAEIAAQLARHHFQAGHREKAVAFSLRAAHRARLGYADEEARAFYQQAVAIAARESIARDMIEFAEAEFSEAPMLAQLVASGELPPVEERLPVRADVKVILPADGIGQYGGTWRNVTWSSGLWNIKTILYDPPIRWKADYTGYEPGLLKSWDVSGDGRRITWRFRKGIRWSDGAPFTVDDLRFWWEDMATNPNVDFSDVPEWGWKADSTPMDVSFPDDYTMVMEWDSPQYVTVFHVAQGYWVWDSMMKPRHYLTQFHPTFTEDATYEDLELADRWLTPGYPTLCAWVVESISPGERVVLVRNPYYWKVDVAGNQLPYIDRLDVAIVPDQDVRVTEASQGKYTASFRATANPKDIPFLAERARAGGYHLHPGAVSGAGAWPGWIINQDFADRSMDNWEEIRDLLRDKRFRRALSHAMDRQRIIDLVWDGVGTPQQGTISPQSWHFASLEGQRVYEEWANAYVEHVPDLAKRLLDEAGMLDADGDGWRELPSGASFQLGFHVTGWGGPLSNLEATETFATDLRAVGIQTLIYDATNMPEGRLPVGQGCYMLRDCHTSELDIWTYPAWIFPVDDTHGWPLQGRWRRTGGAGQWRRTGGAEDVQPAGVAKALLDIYDCGLAEPDMQRRHELVWEAIRIHIEEGPFFIGASGDQAVPVVIADNFRGVPDLVILGPWGPGTPGNLHPEQFWIEQ
jgi:ABC-type transport system substrate-binding protein/DNA-binding SARP family transcriptional activator